MNKHISVLSNEILDNLSQNKKKVIVDGTLGSGGHSRLLAKALKKDDVLICIDRDQHVISRFAEDLPKTKGVIHLVHGNFVTLPEVLETLGLPHATDIILDLGWSMDQFADPARGFSFMIDGPLDMRLDYPSDNETASEILNSWSEKDLSDMFYNLGDETKSRVIAKEIIFRRKKEKFTSTLQLAGLIETLVGRHGKTHPATKVFQALRIQVNHELSDLALGLPKIAQTLCAGGHLSVITFHSGEDRIVKQVFADLVKEKKGILNPKKAITPSKEELASNPRSRSSRLRIFESL